MVDEGVVGKSPNLEDGFTCLPNPVLRKATQLDIVFGTVAEYTFTQDAGNNELSRWWQERLMSFE